MRIAPALLAVALLLTVPAPLLGQVGGPIATIHDRGEMFGEEAERAAREILGRASTRSHFAFVVATVPSLEGQDIAKVAAQNAQHLQASGTAGVSVLLSKEDRKIYIHPFGKAAESIEVGPIRDAFLAEMRKGEPDLALQRMAEVLAEATGRLPAAASEAGKGLVERDRIHLTLAGARRVVAAAEAKAGEMGQKVNIAVVDDGGHLIAFSRMDGARPASGATATTKAISAATFRQATGPQPPGATSPDPLLNLSLQNAAAGGGFRVTTLIGGLPIVVDDQVIGAVGVGGAPRGEQDAEIAKAGLDALIAELGGHAPARER